MKNNFGGLQALVVNLFCQIRAGLSFLKDSEDYVMIMLRN